MEEKKTKKKLTLSISSKKPYKVSQYKQDKQKTSVVIEKKTSGRSGERKFYNRESNLQKTSSGFRNKTKFNNDGKSRLVDSSQIRKIAEERATKRFRADKEKENVLQTKKKNLTRSRGLDSKREYKLTVSKALDESVMDSRERSLASVRRARKKDKNKEIETKQTENKPIVHEVNIPDKITIKELSNRMAIQASGIIKHLMGMGVVATINHTIDADTAEYIVKEFGNIPIREQKPEINFKTEVSKEKVNLKQQTETYYKVLN